MTTPMRRSPRARRTEPCSGSRSWSTVWSASVTARWTSSHASPALTPLLLLLDERQRVPLGVEDARKRGPAGAVEGLRHDGGTQAHGLVDRRPQVAHLYVQGHAAAIALAQVPSRAGLGPAQPGLDLHDEAVADLPVEQLAVERLLALGVPRLDLPVHHRPGPVVGLLVDGHSRPACLLGKNSAVATVVFVHAHPDDEAIFTAGTMCLLAEAGHRVVLVVATGGELGLPHEDAAGPDHLAGVRRAETERAAGMLQVARTEFLGYHDSGMLGDDA